MFYLFQEFFQFVDIFKGWLNLETRVQVDANALGMMKGLYTLSVVRTDAATQQEGDIAIVGLEDAPVELIAAATNRRALGVKDDTLS